MKCFALTILALGSTAILCSAALAQSDTITVIHINDTHSTLMPLGPRRADLKGTLGGIARAASAIRSLRSRNPDAILLHAGDFSVGDPSYNVFFGVPELRILRDLGCDAMAVGNHEWDMGPSTLLTTLDSAFSAGGFPLLSANTRLDHPELLRHGGYVVPATVLRRGALKIGVFGLTGPMANTFSSPEPAVIDSPFAAAVAAVASLRNEGCTPIICLSHLGTALDRALAGSVPGIDLILGGHDHHSARLAVAAAEGEDSTLIVQTSGFYREVGVVRLVSSGGKVRALDASLISLASSVPEDTAVARAAADICSRVEKVCGRLFTSKVGVATATLPEEPDFSSSRGYRDTQVGNLVADAFRDLTGTDIAIEPLGSTAQPLYRGPLVPADLFRIVGYGWNPADRLGYHLVRFDIPGEALLAGINFSLSAIPEDDEFFLQVSGMRYTFNPDSAPANRLVSADVGGVPVDPARKYSVTSNAFVAGFMQRLGIPLANLHEFGADTTEFMALTRYVRTLGPVRPRPLSRILSVGSDRESRGGGKRERGDLRGGRRVRQPLFGSDTGRSYRPPAAWNR